MTVIAAFKISDTPVLIGDILLSRSGKEESHIEIPTSLAIGWTGQTFAAKALIKEIRARFEQPLFNSDVFFSFLKNNEIIDQTVELTIIGWVINKGEPVSFYWSAKDLKVVKTKDTYIEGSGAVKFKEQLKNTEKVTEPATIRSTESACLRALSIVGSLLTEEVLFGNSIQDLYGGGYQIIVFDQGEFTFIDDYIVMPMQYEETAHQGRESLRCTLPKYVLKHKYFNNTLIISRFSIERPWHELNKIFLVRDAQSNFIDISSDEKNSMLSLQAKFYSCFPFLIDIDGVIVLFQTFSVPTSDKQWIYLQNKENNQLLVFERRFIRFIVGHFERAMAKKYYHIDIN